MVEPNRARDVVSAPPALPGSAHQRLTKQLSEAGEHLVTAALLPQGANVTDVMITSCIVYTKYCCLSAAFFLSAKLGAAVSRAAAKTRTIRVMRRLPRLLLFARFGWIEVAMPTQTGLKQVFFPSAVRDLLDESREFKGAPDAQSPN